jgi:hypothetical protein
MQEKSNPFTAKGAKKGRKGRNETRGAMEINVRRLSEVQIVAIRGALRLGPE